MSVEDRMLGHAGEHVGKSDARKVCYGECNKILRPFISRPEQAMLLHLNGNGLIQIIPPYHPPTPSSQTIPPYHPPRPSPQTIPPYHPPTPSPHTILPHRRHPPTPSSPAVISPSSPSLPLSAHLITLLLDRSSVDGGGGRSNESPARPPSASPTAGAAASFSSGG